MKCRQGFVSNSSSCSFVLIGKLCNIEDLEFSTIEDIIEYLDNETDLTFIDDEDFSGLKDNEVVIGKIILKSKDDDMGLKESAMSISEIQKVGEYVNNCLGLENYSDTKIFTGVMMC